MGIADISKKRITSNQGRKLTVTVDTALGMLGHPDNEFSIFITEQGKTVGALCVLERDYSERWLDKFADALKHHPDFLAKFQSKDHCSHSTRTVVLQGNPVEVDTEIAYAVSAINKTGAVTTFCCQGGDGSTPYVVADQLPENLVKTAHNAGMRASSSSIYADAPSHHLNEASEAFVNLLNDWLNEELDTSGGKYNYQKTWRNSLPQLPKRNEAQKKSQQSKTSNDIARLVNMGRKAKFRDFAKLRSGRDKYSSMPLKKLLEACENPASEHNEKAKGLSEADQAKVLRWQLRGLPADMAVRKVLTDIEISQNARPR